MYPKISWRSLITSTNKITGCYLKKEEKTLSQCVKKRTKDLVNDSLYMEVRQQIFRQAMNPLHTIIGSLCIQK